MATSPVSHPLWMRLNAASILGDLRILAAIILEASSERFTITAAVTGMAPAIWVAIDSWRSSSQRSSEVAPGLGVGRLGSARLGGACRASSGDGGSRGIASLIRAGPCEAFAAVTL